MEYFRPLARTDGPRPVGALPLAGGWCWFSEAELLTRSGSATLVPAREIPAQVLDRLTAPRRSILGLAIDRPQLMGVLNVTPDSFSDGGQFVRPEAALQQARQMQAAGASIIDVGGESTRPGAVEVPVAEEITRVAPVIAAIRAALPEIRLSIDTRKSEVARAALDSGANMVNDVAAASFDPELALLVAERRVPVVLMHAQGDPATMQQDPRYGNVLLDVCDFLARRIEAALAAGIAREHILIDPGIGFGKTLEHNLALLRGLSLFHGLGCHIVLGASRKRFIGTLADAEAPADRAPGTLAVTLAALNQGVQFHRVHDMAPITQGLRLWQALLPGDRA